MNSLRAVTLALACLALLGGCGEKSASPGIGQSVPHPQAEEKILNLSIWSDYLAPDTLAGFEKRTGIRVMVTNYSSNEELEGKLAPGHSGYDIVVPSASSYERQIRSGYYQKLDKSKLPNLVNMDPQIQQRLAMHDPNNDYAVLHMWGTTGIGYNVAKVRAAVGANAPVDSWRLVYDPAIAARLKKCGIAVLDSASEMFNLSLHAIGKNPNSQNPAELEAAAAALMKLRPYIRYADTERMITDLANGETCVAVAYNGDVLQARDRAEENHTGQQIAYSIPVEGTISWFDSYLIPRDAPHPGNAHAFINYMLEPEVIAAVTNTVNYANGNRNATPLIDKDVQDDPGVYPSEQTRAKLIPDLADSEDTTRLMTRLWTRFMTGI